jgi:hypothetical protein
MNFFIDVLSGYSVGVQFYAGTAPIGQFLIKWTASLGISGRTLQITYNGVKNLIGSMSLYIDGVLDNSGRTLYSSSLNNSIVQNPHSFYVNRNIANNSYKNASFENLSIVNFVKSPAEILADYNAGGQTTGGGAWLLAPMKPIYTVPLQGESISPIQSLDPTIPFNTQPNQYVLNINGKVNPMSLITDFEEI